VSISLDYLFFNGWCFHGEIKRKLKKAGLPFHVTQQMLSSNQRILDPAVCVQIMTAELRPSPLPVDSACGKPTTGGTLSYGG